MNERAADATTKGFHIINGTWGHKKTKLKNKFGQLNDDDLYFAEGKESELLVRLMAKLNFNEAELQRLINAL